MGFYLKKKTYGIGYKNTFRSFQLIAGKTWTSARYLGVHGQFVCFDNLAIIEAVSFDLSSKIFQKLQEKQL